VKEVLVSATISQWHGSQQPIGPKPKTIKNVVLPLDGSQSSRLAVPIARTLSNLYGATLHIVSVGQEVLHTKEALSHLGLTSEEMQGVVLDACSGDPAEAIVGAAQQLPSSLLVMCTHTGVERCSDDFGAVAESVLRVAPERIVLLAPERGDRAWVIRRVLLAHDGTPSSDCATAPAAEIAQSARAEVIALHVAARKAPHPEQPGSLPAPRYIDQPQHEWPAWAGEFMNRMLAMGAPCSSVQFKLVVTGGQPGSEVAQLARERDVDLVVMAWRGKWRSEHHATRVVIRTSGCPVLLVYSAGE
jgi:nucleotide-binding universal stress UspA family protein